MQLREVNKGSMVVIGGRKWDVLADVEGGVLCLHHDILCKKAFDTDNCNDWKKSSLKKWLNEEFLNELRDSLRGGEPVNYCSNLITEDGLDDYGTSVDKVFLLSAEQYRKYRRFISNANDWWWLITADSTCNPFARRVHADGSLYRDYAYRGNYGVRPACVFSSSILVDEPEKTYDVTVKLKLSCSGKCAEEIRKEIAEYFDCSEGLDIDETTVEVEEVDENE